MTETYKTAALVSANELAGMRVEPNVKIFDVRGHWATPPVASVDQYLAGHIPGAIFLDWTKVFLEPEVPTNLASVSGRSDAADSFARLGINAENHVIVYDDYHHMLSGRVWWALRYWGFTNVSVLNGGWKSWVANGGAISKDNVKTSPGDFIPTEYAQLSASVSDVESRSDDNCLIDSRSAEGYLGSPTDERSGHVPGAVSMPFRHLLDEKSGLFHDNEVLESLFDSHVPAWRSGKIISSCGSGYAGTITLLALHRLGIDAPLFDGSIAVWKQDPARKLERG